jgi:putative transposase
MNPDDMREAWAYLPNGAELGRLNVLSGWRYSRHTLRLRQHILRLRRLGKLKFADEQDPVQIYSNYQRSKTRQNRKEATRTAQVVTTTQQTPPASAEPSVPTSRRRRDAPIIATPLSDLDVQNF